MTKKKTMWEGARGEASEKNHCLLPSLPRPRFSFPAAVTLALRTAKEKTYQKPPATQAVSTRLTLWFNQLFEVYDGSEYAVVKDLYGNAWRPQSGSNTSLSRRITFFGPAFYLLFPPYWASKALGRKTSWSATQVGLAIKLRLQCGFCTNYVSSKNVMAKWS